MSNSTRCAACKYLRRKCPSDCIFSPYFPSNDPKKFEYVHRIYGASNTARMLQRLPVHVREHAAETLSFEAQCRIEDPVYGCVRIIHQLHQQLQATQNELVKTQAEIMFLRNSYGMSENFCHPIVSDEIYFDNMYAQLLSDNGISKFDQNYVVDD